MAGRKRRTEEDRGKVAEGNGSGVPIRAMRVQPTLRPVAPATAAATLRPRSPQRASQGVPRPTATKPLSKTPVAAPALPLTKPRPIPKRAPSFSDSDQSRIPTPRLNESIRLTPRTESPTVPALPVQASTAWNRIVRGAYLDTVGLYERQSCLSACSTHRYIALGVSVQTLA